VAKSKPVETSLDAFHSLDPDKIKSLHKKIVSALEVIKEGTYEDIASHLKEEPVRVWKRMSECHRMGLIHRTGDRKKMASGRQGFIWAAGQASEEVEKKKRVMKGPTVQQFAKVINQKQLSDNNINRLF